MPYDKTETSISGVVDTLLSFKAAPELVECKCGASFQDPSSGDVTWIHDGNMVRIGAMIIATGPTLDRIYRELDRRGYLLPRST